MTTEDKSETRHAPSSDPKVEIKAALEHIIKAEPDKHPIAKSINDFLRRAQDIRLCQIILIPYSINIRVKQLSSVQNELESIGPQFSPDNLLSERAFAITTLMKAIRQIRAVEHSQTPEILEISLFLGLFSAYDIFTGDLLAAIYNKKPELFKRINKKVLVSRILQYESFDEFKAFVLQDLIEKFRRKSYVEQFESLEKRFDIKLKAFDNWSYFVECGQRRNLLTHCGGVVSNQYLEVCKKEGYTFTNPISIGVKLGIESEYFLKSCELLMEVALKLGQTLWRKLFPDEIDKADSHLTNVIYDCLLTETWDRAQSFGQFAIEQRKTSSDMRRKVFIINQAIALKFSGKPEQAVTALTNIDWSGAALDFKLAEAILLDRFDNAAEIMRKIGQEGELINEQSYYEWPLFREFRKSEQCLNTYESIYGHPLLTRLQRAVDQAQSITQAELEKERAEEHRLIENVESLLIDDEKTISNLETDKEEQISTTSNASKGGA